MRARRLRFLLLGSRILALSLVETTGAGYATVEDPLLDTADAWALISDELAQRLPRTPEWATVAQEQCQALLTLLERVRGEHAQPVGVAECYSPSRSHRDETGDRSHYRCVSRTINTHGLGEM
jgi:hypothetical protein